jgi:hypothetical protein
MGRGGKEGCLKRVGGSTEKKRITGDRYYCDK